MGQIYVDDMTLDTLCTALSDFKAKSVGAVSKNARICLMVALEEGHVRIHGWRLCFGRQGVCVQNVAWIGATVAEI